MNGSTHKVGKSNRDDSEIITLSTQKKWDLRRLHLDQWHNLCKLATSFLFVRI